MPSARSALGSLGEGLAAAHLERAGAAILARNWRCRYGEIDLVARLGDQLLFVEVRTGRQGGVAPEESVGPAKAARMRRLAYAYLDASRCDLDVPMRIDLILVELDRAGRVARLDQIEAVVGEE